MIQTLADITPGGSATALSATSIRCRWVYVEPLAANSGGARVGDANVSASRGAEVPKGIGFMFPPIEGDPTGAYDLKQIYVFAASSDKVSVTFEA